MQSCWFDWSNSGEYSSDPMVLDRTTQVLYSSKVGWISYDMLRRLCSWKLFTIPLDSVLSFIFWLYLYIHSSVLSYPLLLEYPLTNYRILTLWDQWYQQLSYYQGDALCISDYQEECTVLISSTIEISVLLTCIEYVWRLHRKQRLWDLAATFTLDIQWIFVSSVASDWITVLCADIVFDCELR